jgi:choline dehydrogenase-like flavoprotein
MKQRGQRWRSDNNGGTSLSTKNDIADVLIVGGGTSGGVAAKHLAEEGFRVVCLEQGAWPNSSEMPGDKPEYELLGAKQWHPDPNVRGGRDDYPINDAESDTQMWMYNAVGGTSVLWAGCWIRALPADFRVRSLDGVADDWPITYEDLLPYYEAMEIEMGVAARPGNPAYPAGSRPAPMDAHPINKSGRKMAEGMNRLGWHWWPGCNGIPTRDYNLQKQCQRYGICRMGCPEGSKASTDVTHFPVAMKHGARIVTGARVSQVTVDANGRANGAVYVREGQEHFQPASVVILAANGVGTPRLLLMSVSSRFSSGLANSSGLVGKRLMAHPYATSVGLYDDDLEDWLGPVGEQIQSFQFYESDPRRGFVRGAKWHIMGTGGPLAMVTRMQGEDTPGEGFWGDQFCRMMKDAIGHMIEWAMVPEDLPEETNFVSLDPTLKDSDGLPAPKIHYRRSENTRRLVDFQLARQLEAHEAAGARKAWVTKRSNPSGHIMGTTVMGDDPAASVVDRFGRAHDVPNLYVVDASVFPTSTGVNITATTCALAKRTATYIVRHARQQEVGA